MDANNNAIHKLITMIPTMMRITIITMTTIMIPANDSDSKSNTNENISYCCDFENAIESQLDDC